MRLIAFNSWRTQAPSSHFSSSWDSLVLNQGIRLATPGTRTLRPDRFNSKFSTDSQSHFAPSACDSRQIWPGPRTHSDGNGLPLDGGYQEVCEDKSGATVRSSRMA
jgi:hypothetical protein